MNANVFTYAFSFCSETVQSSPWKTLFCSFSTSAREAVCTDFSLLCFCFPWKVHAKSSGSNTCFAWDSTCSLTNCAGMVMLQDNKRWPSSWLDGNRKYRRGIFRIDILSLLTTHCWSRHWKIIAVLMSSHDMSLGHAEMELLGSLQQAQWFEHWQLWKGRKR